ncbi:MAG: hypothetical protein QOJ54_1205 [Aliidongia sp.]|jgi:uncharacterized protein (DUF4415 family)|nr:hypothetical protein [Aliidongia sp.]
MAKKEPIVGYSSADELATLKSETDWAKSANKDEGSLPEGWEKTAILGLPPGKAALKLRIDRDVLEWFRGTGKGYQTRMNNVLRAFVAAASHRPH